MIDLQVGIILFIWLLILTYIHWKIWVFFLLKGWFPGKRIMLVRLHDILKTMNFGSKQICV